LSNVVTQTELLRSKHGADYLAARVGVAHLQPFLDQLRRYLGDDEYERYSRNRRDRDGGHYHVTTVSPPECEALEADNIEALASQSVSLELEAIGGVTANDDSAYFVIVRSVELDAVRKGLGLTPIDFHVTLGFDGEDVHDVPKGLASRIDSDRSSTSPNA
jgi:hypothetical protein